MYQSRTSIEADMAALRAAKTNNSPDQPLGQKLLVRSTSGT
jgi:hypothetical protein